MVIYNLIKISDVDISINKNISDVDISINKKCVQCVISKE